MALFASKEASTLPWHAGQVVDVYRVEVDGKPASLVMRDYAQHNEPNKWLTGLRDVMRNPSAGSLQSEAADMLHNAKQLHLVATTQADMTVPPSLEHAIRVLSRLAAWS